MKITKLLLTLIVVALMGCLSYSPLWADGNETLGPPSLTVADGTGITATGTGMLMQPSTIMVEVPAKAVVKQVLLYWEGFMEGFVESADNTIVVSDGADTIEVVGTLIGSTDTLSSRLSTFRADITSYGMIGAGSTTLTLSDLKFDINNGAGIIVIYDDGKRNYQIDLRDGSDFAFYNYSGNLGDTVAQTFTFDASRRNRKALINLFFASVFGTESGGGFRPTSIEITTSGAGPSKTRVLSDLLNSNNGQEWDTLPIFVDIPKGHTSLTIQAFSRDDFGTTRTPASFVWLATTFALETKVPCQGRMTGGGSVFTMDDTRVTRGFQIHCDLRKPNNIEVNWPGGRFHLTELTSATCTDRVDIDQSPPRASFDTFTGTGTGKYNGKPNARIEFIFVDAGEPGTSDTASIKIYDADNNLMLDVSGYLDHGNVQAH